MCATFEAIVEPPGRSVVEPQYINTDLNGVIQPLNFNTRAGSKLQAGRGFHFLKFKSGLHVLKFNPAYNVG